MKILYTNFHRDDGGGHTTYILSLARGLSGRHEISVAAPASSRLYREAARIPGVRVHALQFSSKLPGIVREAALLRGLLRRECYDIVHANGAADHRCAMLAAIGLGRRRPRIVYTKHNDFPAGSLGNTLRARLATDRTICVSEDTRDKLSRTAYRRSGLRVVRNGVDTAYYAPWSDEAAAQARARWLPADAPADALVVGSNAGTAPHKGWADMARAVAGLPEAVRRRVYVLLAGMPFDAAQQAEVEALGLAGRLIHAGLLQDVRPLIAALDVGFVLSWRVETISFACREMMSMGKPVIVSDKGGLVENVTPGVDGWIVPQRSPGAVAQVLADIIAAPDCLARMGQAARDKSIAEFGLEKFVRSTEQIYQELLG
jgi:glycosyltransferase involved in cell wall biosynthesis